VATDRLGSYLLHYVSSFAHHSLEDNTATIAIFGLRALGLGRIGGGGLGWVLVPL
jgi:hypothetical protein